VELNYERQCAKRMVGFQPTAYKLYTPVLECGTIFHPDCCGRDFPSIPSDDLWKHISLATEAPSDSFDL